MLHEGVHMLFPCKVKLHKQLMTPRRRAGPFVWPGLPNTMPSEMPHLTESLSDMSVVWSRRLSALAG